MNQPFTSSRARLVGALLLGFWVSPFLMGAMGGASPKAPPAPALSAPAGMSGGGPSAAADIRDIHDPIWIPAWWRPWMLGIVAVCAAGLAFGAVKLIADRRRRPLSPSERALAQLDEAAPLAVAGQSRAYAEVASGAVRAYLEESFGLPATHRTTDEFFAELLVKQPPSLEPHAVALSHFLGACDLAKFSLYGMAREDMASLNQLARQFVIETADTAQVAAQPLAHPVVQAIGARTP